MSKPIIRWVGGKSQLLETIIPLIPKQYGKYYEPFFGGGALFFAVNPEQAVVNDFNPQLVNTYRTVASSPELLMKQLESLQRQHAKNPDFYYSARSEYNYGIINRILDIRMAALFIYLTKACFNGLYRTNSKGLLNSSSGKKKTVNLYDRENLIAVSESLRKTSILNGDFEVACSKAGKGDFIFFDSPYYNTFDTYQAGGFSEEDHRRLARLFKSLAKKGAYCMLTNSNEEFIKNMYRDYNIKTVDVRRSVNRKGNSRTGREIIITNY